MMSEIPKPQTMQIIQSIKSMHSGFKLISVTVFYFLGHYYYTLNSGFHWINWVLKKFYTNMHPTCPIPICSKCVLTQSIFFPPSLLMSLIFHAIIYYPNQGYNYTVCEICSCSNLNGSSQFVYWGGD